MDPINTQLKHIFADPDLAGLLLEMPLVVGVSGGADSLTLLHALRGIRGDSAPATLHVAHLNHHVRGKEADDDEAFVLSVADRLGIPCTTGQFDVPSYARRRHLSVEDAARRARYAFFTHVAQEHDAAVAVAHNADDQVETVLMNILRGTGLSGLVGMQVRAHVDLPPLDPDLAEFAPFDPSREVTLFRPLLGVWRRQILEYCKQAGLEPRWDSTNQERTYRRNRVRHDLIPTLQGHYSLAIKDHLYNLADIAREEDAMIESMVDDAWARLARADDNRVTFDMPHYADLPTALQRRLARRAISHLAGSLQNVTFAHVEATRLILAGDPGSPTSKHLPHNLQVARRGQSGVISTRQDASPNTTPASPDRPLVPLAWQAPCDLGGEIVLDNNWRLECATLTAPLPDVHKLDNNNLIAIFDLDALESLGPLVWRTRRAGDLMRPMGMAGHKSLQDSMVDAKIPSEQRDHIPILAQQESSQVLWVPGLGGRRSMHAPVTAATKQALLLSWTDGQPTTDDA